MKAFDNLKEIWQQQSTGALPDVTVIINKAKKEQQSMTRKIGIQVIILMLTVIFLAWLVSSFPFKMTTTFMGIGLMFASIFGYSALRLLMVRKLQKTDLTASPQIALQQIREFYNFQQKVNTMYTLIYYIVMNIAFGLYAIEVADPLSIASKIIFLTLYVVWMLIAYFIIGKRQIRKEHAKTESIITALKEIEANYDK
jgi:hypothetical protein